MAAARCDVKETSKNEPLLASVLYKTVDRRKTRKFHLTTKMMKNKSKLEVARPTVWGEVIRRRRHSLFCAAHPPDLYADFVGRMTGNFGTGTKYRNAIAF